MEMYLKINQKTALRFSETLPYISYIVMRALLEHPQILKNTLENLGPIVALLQTLFIMNETVI